MGTGVNHLAPYEPLGNTNLQKYLFSSVYWFGVNLYNVYGHTDHTCAKFFKHHLWSLGRGEIQSQNLKGPLSFHSVFLTLQKVLSWLASIFITILLKRMHSTKPTFEL